MKKTNALRILDRKKIVYTVSSYPHDAEQLSGEQTAKIIGIPSDELFKTLVLRTDNSLSYLVCCIPTNQELDLKKVAKASGEKKVSLLPLKELEPLTGYIRGGCSPIGMKKQFHTFIDSSAITHQQITISSGKRGTMVSLSPADLIACINAEIVCLTKHPTCESQGI